MKFELRRVAQPSTLPGFLPPTLPLPLLDRTQARPLRDLDLAVPDRRAKIWDLSATFHCSIIGTCLTTAELRALLVKLKLVSRDETSDHELHKAGVMLAGTRDAAAKLLNKTLDRKFQRQIASCAPAGTDVELRAFWKQSLEAGDIPGGYWAVMTHPATSHALVSEVFGEIHMLSHLVGAANRADIRRLRDLEAEKASLHDKVERQQSAMQGAVIERDAQIRALKDQLTAMAEGDRPRGEASSAREAALNTVLADVRQQLSRSERRVAHLESQVARLDERAASAAARAIAAETEANLLREEVDALEAQLASWVPPAVDMARPDGVPNAPDIVDLGGATLLYVGGRTGQLPHLKALVQRMNGTLLHHGGGDDGSTATLPACISRACAVLFPVDRISHAAMFDLKRLCKQAGKPYVPLRSSGLAALLRSLAAVRSRLHAAKSEA